MAELEFAVLVRQWLDRRIAMLERLAQEVAAWEQQRNAQHLAIHWTFTTHQAWQTLHRHYQCICSKN